MQDNELEGARNADIDTDTDVELGLNVDMSEFEGDKDVEAEALHDEEDEELAQAAFDLQQPDALDNDIDAMVGSMDEDTQDPVEAFADQGTADACARYQLADSASLHPAYIGTWQSCSRYSFWLTPTLVSA